MKLNKGRSASSAVLFITLHVLSGSAAAENELWVTTDRTDRHTCPSIDCGVAGRLTFRESVKALEENGGWVRITKRYSASCVNGKSEYVKDGNAACISSNGITNGKFAEWVQAKDLAVNRPEDPANGASGGDALIKGSDDYRLYRAQFSQGARKLINEGICSENDFEEMGGWMSSPNRGKGIYFTYCGGMTLSNKVYLNVETGETSR
ncbi:hypothetical protein [Pseudomonas granadensis]|uniref:hypothetical protein n=1 Tax=Pseudomonas granadensis TaxID=1421430 RepID=UPI00300F4494